MADFKCWELAIGLEFVRVSFTERNNFCEGSSEPKKCAQVIWVQGRQPHEFFLTRITCSSRHQKSGKAIIKNYINTIDSGQNSPST